MGYYCKWFLYYWGLLSSCVWLTIHMECMHNRVYNSSNKYTIQCRYKTSVAGCHIVPTSLSRNSIHSVMRLLTLTFECFFSLCCSMILSTIYQVVFWTCVWGRTLFVFQSHKTFHVEDATRTQQNHSNCVELQSVVSWLEKRFWQHRWNSIPAKIFFHFLDEILQFRKRISINKGLRFRSSQE